MLEPKIWNDPFFTACFITMSIGTKDDFIPPTLTEEENGNDRNYRGLATQQLLLECFCCKIGGYRKICKTPNVC